MPRLPRLVRQAARGIGKLPQGSSRLTFQTGALATTGIWLDARYLECKAMQTWTHGTAPESIIERHLVRKHARKQSWIEENQDDLWGAHLREHSFNRITDHGPKDPLSETG